MKTKTSRQINAERKREELPPLNFKLFRKVIEKLGAAPEAYDQSDRIRRDSKSPCGTAACIGGWADVLSGEGDIKSLDVDLDRAGDNLGIGGREWADESRTERAVLFTGSPTHKWPKPYATQWAKVTTRRGQAAVAIRYLTHIIQTGKVLE